MDCQQCGLDESSVGTIGPVKHRDDPNRASSEKTIYVCGYCRKTLNVNEGGDVTELPTENENAS